MEETQIYDLKKIKLDKTPRPEQTILLDFTKKSILNNKKFMIVDAPVGCLTKKEKINIYILKDKNINEKTTEST